VKTIEPSAGFDFALASLLIYSISSGDSNLSLTALFIFMTELIVIFCIEPVNDYDCYDYLGILLRLGVVGLLVSGISKVSSASIVSTFLGGVGF
jgi:hypothetical protein